MILQALYAGDFRPSELKPENQTSARAGLELEKFRAVLERKLSEEEFVLVEKLLNQMLLVADVYPVHID